MPLVFVHMDLECFNTKFGFASGCEVSELIHRCSGLDNDHSLPDGSRFLLHPLTGGILISLFDIIQSAGDAVNCPRFVQVWKLWANIGQFFLSEIMDFRTAFNGLDVDTGSRHISCVWRRGQGDAIPCTQPFRVIVCYNLSLRSGQRYQTFANLQNGGNVAHRGGESTKRFSAIRRQGF